MAPHDRKRAIQDYKKRPAPAGIFALHHAATGQRWVGHAADLDVAMNRHVFTLASAPIAAAACRRRGTPMAARA